MLRNEDRIFTNLYGYHDFRLEAAKKRGVWDNTKAMISARAGQKSSIWSSSRTYVAAVAPVSRPA